jgi:hypothetical protein
MHDPKRWRRPVIYEDACGLIRKVSSTEEASDILISSWPTSAGRELGKAQEIFLQVMSGGKPPSEARAAFIRAAEEADLDVSGN